MKKIYIKEEIYNKIIKILGKKKPELGGMLGWIDDQDCIDTFVFDQFAKVGDAEYNPNTEYLMKIMNSEWERKGIYLAGFVHSHPRNSNQLSYADVEYAQRIMAAFDMNYIFMPIVTSSYEYKTTFNPYIVTIEGRIEKCCVEIEGKKEPEDCPEKNEKDVSEFSIIKENKPEEFHYFIKLNSRYKACRKNALNETEICKFNFNKKNKESDYQKEKKDNEKANDNKNKDKNNSSEKEEMIASGVYGFRFMLTDDSF